MKADNFGVLLQVLFIEMYLCSHKFENVSYECLIMISNEYKVIFEYVHMILV